MPPPVSPTGVPAPAARKTTAARALSWTVFAALWTLLGAAAPAVSVAGAAGAAETAPPKERAKKAEAPAKTGEPEEPELDPEAAYAYDFDRMVLVDGTGIWGKVQLPPGPDGWTVLLEDPRTEDPAEREAQGNSRVLTMPAARVRGISWSLVRRLERLPEERASGALSEEQYRRAQLAIAEFAEKHRSLRPEYHDIARRLYNQMPESEFAPADIHLRLARLYDEQEPASDEIRRRALEQYEAHLARFPDDAEARRAVERLGAQLAPPPDVAAASAEGGEGEAGTEEAPKKPAVAARDEGLEKQAGWSWMLDGVNPDAGMRQYLRPTVVSNAEDGGNQMLRLPYQPIPGKDKLIYQLPSASSGGADRSDRPVLTFKAYLKPDQPAIGIAVAVSTGNYEWFESRIVPVPAVTRWEAKNLRFDLTSTHWKSEASGWQYGATVRNLNQMRTLYILIYRAQDRGEVLLDDIMFEK